MKTEIYIGLMSGTSVDGLDICAVSFEKEKYSLHAAETIQYPEDLKEKLRTAHILNALELAQLHVDFGIFCGMAVKEFTTNNAIHASYIASHGQTVFHTPSTGLTLQIGSGAHIAATCGITTICDFRTSDVAYGGQGAPLVPIGDELLFSEYTYCLNIGGFANISTKTNGERIAWDICPSNIVLNNFARYFGKSYDKNGDIGKRGSINEKLLAELNAIKYYSEPAPKSLGREWVESTILPIMEKYPIPTIDKMRTFYEHSAFQIGKSLQGKLTKTLCTGGGIHNPFLIERITAYSESNLIIPNSTLIDFKEAIIFAYLGYLRVHSINNSLATVTGAAKDVCGGAIYLA